MAEEVDELVIKAKIVGEIERMGGSEEEYLATWDIGGHLRDKWRLSLDSNWVKIRAVVLLAGHDSTDIKGIYEFAPTVVPGLSRGNRWFGM